MQTDPCSNSCPFLSLLSVSICVHLWLIYFNGPRFDPFGPPASASRAKHSSLRILPCRSVPSVVNVPDFSGMSSHFPICGHRRHLRTSILALRPVLNISSSGHRCHPRINCPVFFRVVRCGPWLNSSRFFNVSSLSSAGPHGSVCDASQPLIRSRNTSSMASFPVG